MSESKKRCIGTGKASGYESCDKIVTRFKFGLCRTCFFEWLNTTPEGENYQPNLIKSTLNRVRKESKVKRKYVKWEEKPLSEMVKHVQDLIVNPYIRMRDIETYTIYNCISGGGKISDAGHFFNVKNYGRLRFCIQNIHGQSYSHNRDSADPGHLNQYRQGLINRFGEKYLKELEQIERDSKDWPKLDRISLIEIAKTYENLTKKKLWCFRHEEFENYKNILNK